jgi:hypothetical protein
MESCSGQWPHNPCIILHDLTTLASFFMPAKPASCEWHQDQWPALSLISFLPRAWVAEPRKILSEVSLYEQGTLETLLKRKSLKWIYNFISWSLEWWDSLKAFSLLFQCKVLDFFLMALILLTTTASLSTTFHLFLFLLAFCFSFSLYIWLKAASHIPQPQCYAVLSPLNLASHWDSGYR